MTAPDRLAEIEARIAAATPGSWEWVKSTYEGASQVLGGDRPVLRTASGASPFSGDAELIAHAPADLAALVAVVKAVKAVADRIEPHADNLAARGDIETSVPLHNAVKSIRAALHTLEAM